MDDFIKQIPVYIIHYKKLTKRKDYLDNALKQFGFENIHWIDHIDRDTMTTDDTVSKLHSFYKYDEDRWYELNAIWKEFKAKPRPLAGGELACALSHIYIYKDIIDKSIDYALVFEDDAILLDNFAENLYNVYKELICSAFEICYLGDAFGWTVDNFKSGYLGSLNKNKIDSNKLVYPIKNSKCAESFLLSFSGANKLYEGFTKKTFCLPPDWMHTPIIMKENMKCFWSEPALVHQGSVDVYSSSVGRD